MSESEDIAHLSQSRQTVMDRKTDCGPIRPRGARRRADGDDEARALVRPLHTAPISPI